MYERKGYVLQRRNGKFFGEVGDVKSIDRAYVGRRSDFWPDEDEKLIRVMCQTTVKILLPAKKKKG